MTLNVRYEDGTAGTISLDDIAKPQTQSEQNKVLSQPKDTKALIEQQGLLFDNRELAKLTGANPNEMHDSRQFMFDNKDIAKLTKANEVGFLDTVKDLVGLKAIEDTIEEASRLEREYVDIDKLTREKIMAEKANNANTIGQLLDTVWYKTTGNDVALEELNILRREQSKKIIDTIARLNPNVQVQARETNGIIEYFAKEGNKWKKIDYEWYKEFAANLDDSARELLLGATGGFAGAYYGRQAGNALKGAYEAWAGSKLKKLGKAGKAINNAIGEGLKWGATGIGTAVGSLLGTGVGATADTLFAQQQLGEQLDYAVAMQSGAEAATYSALLSVMAKPAFQIAGLGAKGIAELTSHLVVGNISGARAALKSKTNLTDTQVKELTQEFTRIYGETQALTRVGDEIFALGLRPENLPTLEKAAKFGTSEGALKFVSGIGEEFVKEAGNKVNVGGLKEVQSYLIENKASAKSLSKTHLYKQLTKGNINVDTMARSLVNNVEAFDESYGRIMKMLPKELKADVENLVVSHVVNNNSKMVDNFYAVNFTKIADELAKFNFTTADAKMFYNTIKGSSKYIDNSYNLISRLNAAALVPGSGIGTSIIGRLKTFGMNTLFRTFSVVLRDDIAAMFHLGRMLDKPMEAKTYKELSKALNMSEDEVLEATKQFRDTYYSATKGGIKTAREQFSSTAAGTQDIIANDLVRGKGTVVDFPANTSVVDMQQPSGNTNLPNVPPRLPAPNKQAGIPNVPPRLPAPSTTFNINMDNSSRQILDELLKEKGAQVSTEEVLYNIKRYLNPRAKRIIESLGNNKLGNIDKIVRADIELLKNIVSSKSGVVLDGLEANILLYKILTEIANDNVDDIALKAQTKAFPTGIKYK